MSSSGDDGYWREDNEQWYSDEDEDEEGDDRQEPDRNTLVDDARPPAPQRRNSRMIYEYLVSDGS